MFLDEVTLQIAGGTGGSGCVSFRREKYVAKGGPNGGDGGRGGSVFFVADAGENTLLRYRVRRVHRAESGRHGEGNHRTGKSGADLELTVPVGTQVLDQDGVHLLGDLDVHGARLEGAKGGRGGQGNARFTSSTRQAPRFAQKGEPGEERSVQLQLKLVADIGLVGFPNAGKSTLISRISAAKPEIADYPFTTLVPHLGVIDAGNFRSFVVADIPGLIEGAHEGRGLGDRFLRHVERCSALVFLVDVSELAEHGPVEALEILEREVRSYDEDLALRPRIVVASKVDVKKNDEAIEVLRSAAASRSVPFAVISAVRGDGLGKLLELMSALAFDRERKADADHA